jgi:hypothetical protein
VATTITLNELVEAIARAVNEAQDRVEHYQTKLLESYFDADHRPEYFRVRVPSLREGASDDAEEELVVPTLALVGATRLAIKQLEISTTVTIGDVADFVEEDGAKARDGNDNDGGGGAAAPSSRRSGRRRDVQLDLGASTRDPTAATAGLKITLEAGEPTEGLTRLMIELNKRIRSYPKTPSRGE